MIARKTSADSGQSRILEAVIAAMIIFIVFAASSFFINSTKTTIVQERADLDRLGYKVLSKLIESGTIDATIERPAPITAKQIQLKAFLQHSLPSAILFNLTILNWTSNSNQCWRKFAWVNCSLNNADDNSFSNSAEVSSTPTIYTSKGGNIYQLILVLANAGQETKNE